MIDSLISEFDKGLRALFSCALAARVSPGAGCVEQPLSESERNHSAALMRINHVGEICAQALYQGQALTAASGEIRSALANAAREEVDHLAWTAQRVGELGSHRSVLAPVWYVGSLAIGAAAGLRGDAWSLGFLAETERQVEAHLEEHLSQLPVDDAKSRAIVLQMKVDERAHADLAVSLGGLGLPNHVKSSMRFAARVMKGVSYYL